MPKRGACLWGGMLYDGGAREVRVLVRLARVDLDAGVVCDVNENEYQNLAMVRLDRSDLTEWANHEHEHMSKLFDDLRETFGMIARGELVGKEREEAVELALEDLEVALEDMLEHFNEEEEVYFFAIEQHFPEFGDHLEQLVVAHEEICAQIKTLKRGIVGVRGGQPTSWQVLNEQVQGLVGALGDHNDREREVFQSALARLNEAQLKALIEVKEALG